MILTELHYRKFDKNIIRLCRFSKALYNKCNWIIRKSWFAHEELPSFSKMLRDMKHTEEYLALGNAKISTTTIKKLYEDWSNFKKAYKDYYDNKNKYEKAPNPPKKKNKLSQVIFYNKTIQRKAFRNGYIVPTNGLFSVKTKLKNFKQVVVTPLRKGYVIEISYEQKETKEDVDENKVIAIDLGINNLCAITSNQNLEPILINGKPLKSINQYYNKNKTRNRSHKRKLRIENYFHNTSRWIINYCLKHKIGTIIIGKNVNWKNEISLGKKTNQTFCFIPYNNLIQKITYKAQLVGIKVIITEESYTSQASAVDNDVLPVYNCENKEKYKFSGKRIERGLYKSNIQNFVLNADVNGSYNIGRKVIPEFCENLIRNRSLGARPRVVNPIRASV